MTASPGSPARPSKSRLNFLDLLRAGRPDDVINAPTAAAYLVEHKVADAVIVSLLGHERQSFADEDAWQAHLDSFDLGAGHPPVWSPKRPWWTGIVARGLLADTVIVSDDAGRSTSSSIATFGSFHIFRTYSKLAVSLWVYLGARLKVPETDPVPWFPDLICQCVPA